MLEVFGGIPPAEGARQPLVDVVDRGKEIIVSAELPGVDKKDIQLSVEEDSVSIKAERKAEVEEAREEEGYYFRERSYASYSRRVPLPAEVIPEKAAAEFKNGILTVSLPKRHPEEPREKGHRVEIK
jgi:HSP20 family protein